MRDEREQRRYQLAGYRYLPHDLTGVVALLLFFLALIIGAGVAVILRGLF